MKLRELLNGVPVASCAVDLEMEIAGVAMIPGATQPGDLVRSHDGLRHRRPQVYRHGAGKGRRRRCCARICRRGMALISGRRIPAVRWR